MTPKIALHRQPAIRSFLFLFTEAGATMRGAVNEAIFAAFNAGRSWGQKPLAGEIAFAICLDGVIRPYTVRSRASDCRNDYLARTGKRWSELRAAGFRVRKVQLLPVSK